MEVIMGDAALRLGSLSDSVNRVLPQTLTFHFS